MLESSNHHTSLINNLSVGVHLLLRQLQLGKLNNHHRYMVDVYELSMNGQSALIHGRVFKHHLDCLASLRG